MKKNILRLFPTLLVGLLTLPSLVSVMLGSSIQAKAAPAVITTRSSQSYIDSYYSSVNLDASGDSLKNSLASLLKSERKASFSYGSHQSAAFPYTDVDPTRPNDGYIVSFYSGTAVKGYSGMNKEHTWPDSHGGNKIESDPHVIRPTLTSENSARGNQYYGQAPNAGWDPASFNNPKYRGISARIIFYGATIGASSGLIIEDVARGQGSGTGNKMGKLGDLLKWNLEYPVDVSEIIRNETLDISLNYNRNPFIDDPLLACKIWGNTNTSTQSICAASSVEPTAMTITPNSATINVGSTQTLTLGVTPSNASKTVVWTSSSPSVASVNDGVVTPLTVGVTTITATSQVNNSIKATAVITVTNNPIAVTGVSLDRSSASLSLGHTLQLKANISPSSATNKNVTWTSSNNSVATVSSSGLVSAQSLGTTTITVTTLDGNFVDSAVITVTALPAVTSITGKFYNSSTANSGGENGVTTANINNGIAGVNALGFSGTAVVSSVKDIKNGYYPRSAGLAIGSSSNSGSITLVLNENYKAFKVEARFNLAGITDPSLSVSGDQAVKTSTPGTPGTAASNPSTGTPYIVEFASAVSQITITASKRTALVELTIHYGEAPVEVTPQMEANNWALSFLDLTSSGCENANFTALESVWAEATSSFNALSIEAKAILNETIPNGDGDAIEEALARYVVIIDNYELYHFIPGIIIPGPGRQPLTSDPTNTLFTLLAALSLAGIVASFFVIRKKTKQGL